MSKTSPALLEHAFDHVPVVAEVLGEPRIHQRPRGPTTNAVGTLIVHRCEVSRRLSGSAVGLLTSCVNTLKG